MTHIPCQRHLFDMPRDIAYLNCAYMSPLAHGVMEAMAKGVARKAQPWSYTAAEFVSIPEETRALFAVVFGTAAEDIAIIPSASYGLAVAARNLPIAAGQSIIVLGDQFPSNLYVWREKAKAAGATITTVWRDPGAAWTPAVLDAIGPDTAIVAVPNCHWADGGLVDLVAVGTACRKVGAALVLDLTQSLGAMPFDVGAVDPDFAVAACYKWLMGPYGIGALYVAPRHQQGEPIEQTWMGRAGSEDFSRLVDYRDDYQPGARRFDMGEKSNPALLLGASAALRMLDAWGIANIAETLTARSERLAEKAAALGFTALPVPARAGHFLALGHTNGLPASLPERLAAEQVFVSLRGQSLRVTPHLYSDDEDIDQLIAVLGSALG